MTARHGWRALGARHVRPLDATAYQQPWEALATGPDPRRPTQVAHPWRATARTLLATLVPLIVAAPEIYAAITQGSPATAAGWGAGVLAAAGAMTRVMAVPAINDLLTRFGLGATPKEHT